MLDAKRSFDLPPPSMPKVETKNALNADQLLVSDYSSPVSSLRFPPSPPTSSPPPSQSSKTRKGTRFEKVPRQLIPNPPEVGIMISKSLGDNRVKFHDIRERVKRVDQQDRRRLNKVSSIYAAKHLPVSHIACVIQHCLFSSVCLTILCAADNC